LVAVKLRGEPRTLHLRSYLAKPSKQYDWANIQLAPQDIQLLAAKTSERSALAWSVFASGGVAPSARISDSLSQLAASEGSEAVIDALDQDTGRALARC